MCLATVGCPTKDLRATTNGAYQSLVDLPLKSISEWVGLESTMPAFSKE